MLAKLAQEQMEIEHPGFQQYRCSICGKGEHHNQMFAAHQKHLEYQGLTPIYQLPEHSVYPVCSACNIEHFQKDDEEDGRAPDYSDHRKGKGISHQCMRCRVSLDNTEDFEWQDFDYAKIYNIDLTEAHTAMAEALGSGDELPVCMKCEEEIEDEEEKKCAVCGHMEHEDDMTEMDLETIETESTVVYKLTEGEQYPVCNDCYHSEFYTSCDMCSDGTLRSEMNEVTWPNGNEEHVCNDCHQRLYHCDTCNAAIDTENDNYHMDEYGDTIYCENHIPTNDNDFEQLDSDAEDVLEAMLEPMAVDDGFGDSYHLSVNPKIIQKLERTFAHALKKYKGAYMPDKVSRHVMRVIDQLAIEPGEKAHLKEFLWLQPLEPGQSPKVPLQTDRLALLLGHVTKIQNFRASISETYDISKKHKFLRDLMPIPVSVTVDEPHDNSYHNSFTVALVPNNEVMETAKTVWGNDGREVWDLMSKNTHHSGAVAYCRVGNYEGEWLIENLQSDSDVQRIKTRLDPNRGYMNNLQSGPYRRMKRDEEYKARVLKIARWWMRQFRGWQPFLMMLVMQMAEDSGTELYITDTQHQKRKWGGIPDRSAIIYDAIPEELYDARMKALRKEVAEHEDIPEEQVTDEMINEYAEVFPRPSRYHGATEKGEWINSELWRLANQR